MTGDADLVKALHKHLACPHNSPIPTGAKRPDLPARCKIAASMGCACLEAVQAVRAKVERGADLLAGV